MANTLHRELERVSFPQLAVLGSDELFPDWTQPQFQNVLQLLNDFQGSAELCLKVMVLVIVLRQVGQTKHGAT